MPCSAVFFTKCTGWHTASVGQKVSPSWWDKFYFLKVVCTFFAITIADSEIADHTWLLSPRIEALWRAVAIRLPMCVAGATWGLQQWITGGGDWREIFKRALCLKPVRDPCWCALRPMLDGFAYFCAFCRSCSNSTVRQIGGAIHTATFAISRGTTGRRCSVHIFVRMIWHWAYCKHDDAGIITPDEKEKLCIALSLFFMGQGGRCFGFLFWHSPILSIPSLICFRCNNFTSTGTSVTFIHFIRCGLVAYLQNELPACWCYCGPGFSLTGLLTTLASWCR